MVTQLETWRSAEKQELWLRAIEGNNFPLTNLAVLLYKANSCINVWKWLCVSNKWKTRRIEKEKMYLSYTKLCDAQCRLVWWHNGITCTLQMRRRMLSDKSRLEKKHQNSSFDCRRKNEEYNFHIFCITTLFNEKFSYLFNVLPHIAPQVVITV